MFLISYLALDDPSITAVQERLALAKPPLVLVVARSVPELINQVQTLPLRAVVVDISWPRTTWMHLITTLRATHPALPILALASSATETVWWELADDLLRLDESLELFLFRLHRTAHIPHSSPDLEQVTTTNSGISDGSTPVVAVAPPTSLLENSQFRHFAQIFSRMDEPTIVEAFVAWAQQACQTSRAVLMLRDDATGEFMCRAHRGLPSTLVPHCRFTQTAPLCRWLMTSGRILLRDGSTPPPSADVLSGLEMMQAVAAVPILFDGQLVGILGIGPRLIGPGYNAMEIEGLFALCGHMAMTIHHCQMVETVRQQQQMTEHMLRSMPTGTIVLGDDARIAFANAAAATIIGSTRASLEGLDLRALPSPLGDLAYEVLVRQHDLPRRVLTVATTGLPAAVSGFPLATTPPSAMLLLEDLTAQQRLEEERGRRVDLEVVTNLVHYLAHELRNPLVSLSTFGKMVPTHAGDPEFQEFCASVLQSEIGRVNLILEQLLVLTNHAEFQFRSVEFGQMLERVIQTEEMREQVVVSTPVQTITLTGDPHRLETALTCMLRTAMRLASQQAQTTVRIELDGEMILFHAVVPLAAPIEPEWLLNPWQQLLEHANEDVDFGLATAKYIIEQHGGNLALSVAETVMTIVVRLPLHAEQEVPGEKLDVEESPRRR